MASNLLEYCVLDVAEEARLRYNFDLVLFSSYFLPDWIANNRSEDYPVRQRRADYRLGFCADFCQNLASTIFASLLGGDADDLAKAFVLFQRSDARATVFDYRNVAPRLRCARVTDTMDSLNGAPMLESMPYPN